MKKYIQSICFASVIKLASFFKVSFIVGSQMAWFSVSSILAPVSGAFLGTFGSLVVLLVRCLLHVIAFKTISLSFLAFVVPGYCASLYWATRSSLVRVAIPLICMILFIVHPVGGQACIYSFYWLIPIVLYFIAHKTLFFEALGSTFIAHAVGSLIWLYTVPSTVEMWLGMVPLVAVERLLFAVSMVIVYKIIVGCSNVKTSCVYYGWKSSVGRASGISAN